MKAQITDRLIKDLATPTKRCWVMDTKLPGFGLRMSPNGKKVFVYRYRIGAQQRTYTIAAVEKIQSSRARERARELSTMVAQGTDPATERDARRGMPLFREWATTYLETTHKRSISDDEGKLRNVLLPEWGSRPIDSIRPDDIRRLLSKIQNKGLKPGTVNRYRSLISALMSRAVDAGHITQNPAAKVPKLAENNERVRMLSDEDAANLLRALEAEPLNSRNAILMCLFTGRRRGDVLSMTWDHIDFERASWHIPRGKDQRAHWVPLPKEAVAVLLSQRSNRIAGSNYVFPGRHGRDRLATVQKSWKSAASKAGLRDFRLHDLRHNYASRVVQDLGSLYVAAQLLGHSDLRTTRRYAHLTDNTLATAAQGVASSISQEVKPPEEPHEVD
ncbi:MULTISPECIES: site-specific integrase [unclassified Thioalkalivibrio]|uniref:tyrosine-type recombinase/integrase n=1 Tax=Thioalkalivibrio sp. ALgr5 TaxID=1158162 RepID=UPI0021015C91|nr:MULTISPECIES: site-specific integrase [unclassified Thioalkalivibrio]